MPARSSSPPVRSTSPHIPAVERGFEPGCHSCTAALPQPEPACRPGRVLVVGAGNSGLQIAEELDGTHEVVVAAGTQPDGVPQRFAGQDLFWWLVKLGLMNKTRRLRASPDASAAAATSPSAPPEGDGPPTASTSVRGSAQPTGAPLCSRTGPGPRWTSSSGQPGSGPTTRGSRRTHQPGRAAFARGGASEISGLWFLGLPWQRTRGSSLLGFVRRDAEHIAHHIAAHVRTHVGTHVSTAAG